MLQWSTNWQDLALALAKMLLHGQTTVVKENTAMETAAVRKHCNVAMWWNHFLVPFSFSPALAHRHHNQNMRIAASCPACHCRTTREELWAAIGIYSNLFCLNLYFELDESVLLWFTIWHMTRWLHGLIWQIDSPCFYYTAVQKRPLNWHMIWPDEEEPEHVHSLTCPANNIKWHGHK